MKIGIPKETKNGEFRVALVPEHVRQLVEEGHDVYVEKGAGVGSRFTDSDYRKVGAKIKKDVFDCKMIVKVKEPKIERIKPEQIIMAYLHVEKGQNMELLKTLLDKNVTSYAYEEIRNERGCRLVNLGVEAGIVGMYEGLRLYGQIHAKNGRENRFKRLKPIREYFSVKEVYKALKEANVHNGVNVYIFGKGRVSSGAQEVLSFTDIKPNVLYRDKTIFIKQYLSEADIIVNAVDWYPGEARIITKSMLKIMKKTAVIVDISCDPMGAIETCIPTTWEDPYYDVNGVTHYCVDNLPSAIPRDSSIHLSEMIFEHVRKVANSEILDTGLMTKEGIFEYASEKEISFELGSRYFTSEAESR